MHNQERGLGKMTDKEFKRLTRAQLIDVIYQLQLQIDDLTEKNKSLEKDLADKRLRMSKTGNIAEAALEINECFKSAQNAAEQYLNEIKILRDEIEQDRQRILTQARAEAASIIVNAKKSQGNVEAFMESILKEYGNGCKK